MTSRSRPRRLRTIFRLVLENKPVQTRIERALRVGLGALFLATGSACAPALPSFAGGSTTPAKRFDVGLGAGAAIATKSENANKVHQNTGVAPVAWARLGIHREWDIGLTVAGSTTRVDARKRFSLKEGDLNISLISGIAPYVGVIQSNDALGALDTQGFRMGGELPLALTFDIAGLYELWVGPRIGIEKIVAHFDPATAEDPSGWRVWTGGVVGLALGFRHLQVLMELNVLTEHTSYDASAYRSLGGASSWPLILLPAFGLRYRS